MDLAGGCEHPTRIRPVPDVLEAGAIVEQSGDDQLLASRGYYAALWRHQSGGFVEERAS